MSPHITPQKVVMVPCAPIISLIMYPLCFMFNPLHSSTNQGLFDKHLCNQSICCKKYRWCRVPLYYQLLFKSEASIALLCQLCLTSYTAVWIRNCSKSISVIKVATTKNIDNFFYAKKAITYCHTYHYRQKWMGPETGTSMKNVCQKAPLRLKQSQTVKKLSPQP